MSVYTLTQDTCPEKEKGIKMKDHHEVRWVYGLVCSISMALCQPVVLVHLT